MADWAEVRRLADDFQRIQASTIAHKLSERNCVELVAKLFDRGLLDIVYTTDGKEYVTPDQLDKEIRSELHAYRGKLLGMSTHPSCNAPCIPSCEWPFMSLL